MLPIQSEATAAARLPTRLRMLTTLDLTHPYRGQTELERLVRTLQQPLLRREQR